MQTNQKTRRCNGWISNNIRLSFCRQAAATHPFENLHMKRTARKWWKISFLCHQENWVLIIQFYCDSIHYTVSIPNLFYAFHFNFATCLRGLCVRACVWNVSVSCVRIYPFNRPFQIKIITIYFFRLNSSTTTHPYTCTNTPDYDWMKSMHTTVANIQCML